MPDASLDLSCLALIVQSITIWKVLLMFIATSSAAPTRRQRLLSQILAVGTIIPLALSATADRAEAASPDIWDRVAACESSGNWSSNTGNGFYGGLQFTASTWAEFGGLAYAPSAHLASKEQQITIAEKVLEGQGPAAWPVCSIEAELPRGGDEAQQPNGPSQNSSSTTVPSSVQAATTDASSPAKHLQACAPVTGRIITTAYRQAGAWAEGFHTGVDFAVPIGTSVWSAAPGTVVSAGWQGAYGEAVMVRHDDGMFSLYAHLSEVSAVAGDKVTAGQQLGVSGSTGNSTGPHLHFEVRTSNDYGAHTDPLAYLRGIGVSI